MSSLTSNQAEHSARSPGSKSYKDAVKIRVESSYRKTTIPDTWPFMKRWPGTCPPYHFTHPAECPQYNKHKTFHLDAALHSNLGGGVVRYLMLWHSFMVQVLTSLFNRFYFILLFQSFYLQCHFKTSLLIHDLFHQELLTSICYCSSVLFYSLLDHFMVWHVSFYFVKKETSWFSCGHI
jgi:hypothetical protein